MQAKWKPKIVLCKLVSVMLVVSVLMPWYGGSVHAADTEIVSEDFSKYSPGPLTIGSGNAWTKEGTAPVMNIVRDSANGSSYAAISHDLTGSSYLGQRFAPQSGGMIYEFDVNIPTSKGATLWVMDGKVNATTAAALRYQLDAGVIKRGGSGTYPQINYDTTHWYRFKIIFNIPQRKYTVNIVDLNNGSSVTWPETFYSDRAKISSFGFFVNASGGKINLANVRVTSMDLALSQLQLGAGNYTPQLEPFFDPNVEAYSVNVPYNINSLSVTPIASNPTGVNLQVGNANASNGTPTNVELTGSTTNIGVKVTSSVYTDIARTYSIQVNKLEKSPNLNFVTAQARDSKVLIGWEETIDPTYKEAHIYKVNPDSSLTLVDKVPKGKYISTISGLSNGTPYTFVAKGFYEDQTESSGVTVSATPIQLPARQMESLNRGLVAMKEGQSVYVGWRLLGTDPSTISFNLYRDGVRINSAPLTESTNYLDVGGTSNSAYFVRTVIGGVEQSQSETVKVWDTQYLTVPIRKPADGVNPVGEAYSYRANDATVADLDGDGEYEIILKWDPTNSKDNSLAGYTGNTYVDAYKMDGTFLWRIDLGKNIRSGAHYLHVMAYDLDGDGKAEVSFRTADGTVDGQGNVIGDANADYRNSSGYVLAGPEYFTVFEGATGKALASDAYDPPRGNVGDWGDTYGNRVDRFLSAIAYLDGEKPSLIMQRGYYTRMVVAAYNWRNGQLTKVWTFDSNAAGNSTFAGQGNHQLSVADADGDGKDEIFTGAAAIDHDGKAFWNSRLGHGDAMHLGDLDPTRLGLELFAVQEETGVKYSADMKDARTGRVLWGMNQTGLDTGRGLSADVDPRFIGEESWAIVGDWNSPSGGLYTAKGAKITNKIPSSNFAIWWDGDLNRELLDHNWLGDPLRVGVPKIDKWNYETNQLDNLITMNGTYSNNDTKGNPALQADIIGDWREEVIVRTQDSSALRIYSTTDVTNHRIHTLMQDPIYRLGIAWQNTGYNQPPHTSFYLGNGMTAPDQPNIQVPPVSASGVAVVSLSDKVTVGDLVQLMPVFTPASTTNTAVTWSVVGADGKATSAATISADGQLKAVASAVVKVIVTANDGSGVSGEKLIEIKNRPGTITQTVTADADGKGIVDIRPEDMQAAVGSATDTVTVEILPSAGTTQVQVALPAQVLETARDNNLDTLVVRMGLASMVVDLDLMKKIVNNTSSKVNLGVGLVDPSKFIYSFDLNVDGKDAKGLGNDVSVEIDYVLKPDDNPKKIEIFYLDDHGKVKSVKADYDAETDKVKFKLNH